jgi:hypothetical protein
MPVYRSCARGLRPDADCESHPGWGWYVLSTADIARWVALSLRMAGNEHGSVLRPETVATMFRPHFNRIACRGWVGVRAQG